MRIAVTGSTGLVGKAAITALRDAGHEIVRLVRSQNQSKNADTALWNPATGDIDTSALGDVRAVLHLAGENVAGGRWSKKRKQAIHDSRGPATRHLCETLAALPKPPEVFISASGISVYPQGDAVVDEDAEVHPASGNPLTSSNFLADVVREWEAGTQPLEAAGTRVVHLRISLVLSREGGALQRMLPAFRFGVGGRLGDGKHWMSWITLHDLVRVIEHSLDDASLRGPVLAASPTPVTNREFTRTLGRALRRPTFLPAPRFALRLAFGEMADALLLANHRAQPRRLLDAGFTFAHSDLESALSSVLSS